MDLDKLRELISLFQGSDLSEIEIDEAGSRIRLTKAAPAAPQAPVATVTAPAVASAPLPAGGPLAPAPTPASIAPEPAPGDAGPAEAEEDLVTIDSPMVGVFYSASTPGEPTFVNPGDTIDVDQTVCIVEAMKLMNEVTAKFRAVIIRVLVDNGEPVEYGQPLFAVRPLEQA